MRLRLQAQRVEHEETVLQGIGRLRDVQQGRRPRLHRGGRHARLRRRADAIVRLVPVPRGS
jgi:hypothetical protein